jgi:hypothetical protein
VAIVDDISRDRRTKNVLAQTNTKTVSAPPASTGLVGDQSPAEIFTVEDFDLVKNQIHLEEKNFQLMEALNVMGQITNMQSQSGPIANTAQVVNTNISDSGTNDVFVPGNGEVWQLNAAASSAGYTGLSFLILKITDTSNSLSVEISSQTSYNTEFSLNEPIYIGYPCKLIIQSGGSGTGGSTDIAAALIRVR